MSAFFADVTGGIDAINLKRLTILPESAGKWLKKIIGFFYTIYSNICILFLSFRNYYSRIKIGHSAKLS
jgi:hypothetical protein